MEDKKVIITRTWVGIFGMQVCVVMDAADEEILEICNKENPAGTKNGWVRIIRAGDDQFPDTFPVPCEKYPDRQHLIVIC